MMQKDVRGAGRHHAERRADDATTGVRSLDQWILEILIEEIRDAHRIETQRVINQILTQLHRFLAHVHHFEQVTRLERSRVRRRAQQELPDEAALAHDVAVVTHGGVGVAVAVAGHLAARCVRIDISADVIAILGDCHTAAVRHDLQAVLGQVQAAVDLGAQQAAHVGTIGVLPVVLVQGAADRCPADKFIFLDHQSVEPCLGEVGAIGQAVVACADDDRIIFFCHGY